MPKQQEKPTPLEAVDVLEESPDDARFFSVTTILKAIPNGGLEYWAIKMAAMAAIDSKATWTAMLDESGRDETVKWLCGARYRSPRFELSAADLGTVVHKAAELYSLSGERPTQDWIENEIARHAAKTISISDEGAVVKVMLDQFDNWLQIFQPEYTAAEMAVYSDRYGYAGTLDAILTVDGVRFLSDYKGLDVTTPLATPDGWTTMGAVQVGDQVFGTDGHPVVVTAKSDVHLNRCYRVTFDDATSIVCDDEHLWQVRSGYVAHPARHGAVLRTDELAQEVRSRVNRQHHWQVAMPEPLQLPAAELPIDPYVYGCWLGDGYRNGGTITKPDDELFELIEARGYRVGEPHGNNPSKVRCRNVFGLRTQLRIAGLLGHRDIPQIYLRGSVEQRIDLLRGLMDTDGSWNRARGQAIFSSTNKSTAETVYELVTSLGERCVLNTAQAYGFGKHVTAYSITWRPRLHNPFMLSRKANRVQLSAGRVWRRLIISIEPTLTVPTQCITVDADDGCYLAGNQMVPTHNTRREVMDARGKPQRPYAETALQLAAYRHADVAPIVRARRFESPQKRRYYLLNDTERDTGVPVPEVDGGLCILITPGSCQAYPMRCDEVVFDHFLYALENFRWIEETSKVVVGDPLSK